MKCIPHKVILVTTLLAVSSCDDTKEPTHTRMMGEPCNQIDNCEGGLFCENGLCRKPCNNKEDCGRGYDCRNSRCAISDDIPDNCGNGQLDTGEQCDDNNSADGDGCSSVCAIESGYTCDNKNTTSVCTKICGNGQKDASEECDDGNNNDGDGCNKNCVLENNYQCHDWPSVCSCKEGFQDSNSDGICQPDCDQCPGNYVCQYSSDGLATGCGCPDGTQDSNSDNTCLSDCNCDSTQECQYNDEGVAQCLCPAGTQDNDGNNTCLPSCQYLIGSNQCAAYTSCDDTSGTAICSCTIYVDSNNNAATANGGGSWDRPNNSLENALDLLETMRQIDSTADNFSECDIWVTTGNYASTNTLNLSNVRIYGGFSGTEKLLSERLDSKFNNKITEISGYYKNPDHPEFDHRDYHQIFTISGHVVLDKIHLQNGMARKSGNDPARGAAISGENFDSLLINNCSFNNNLIYSNIDDNSAFGGAVYLKNGRSVNINATEFGGNYIYDGRENSVGGALALDSIEAVKISNTYFSSNGILGYGLCKGGALYTNNSTVEIKDSLFKNNSVQCSADTYGGAISSNNSRLTIIDSGFLSNTATDYRSSDNILGGAIYSDNQKESSLTISNSSFNNNRISATGGELSGGAIYNATDKAKFDRLTILNNSNIVFNGVAKSLGAGIYNSGKGVTGTNLFINNTQISPQENNYQGTLEGSAIYNSANGTIEIGYSTFYKNNIYENPDLQLVNAGDKSAMAIYNSLLQHDNDNTFDSQNNYAGIQFPLNTFVTPYIALDSTDNRYIILSCNSCDTPFFSKNQLVGQFVLIDYLFLQPIIANDDYNVTVLADWSSYSRELSTLYILDMRLVTSNDDSGSRALITDHANPDLGPQPETDLMGAPRRQGNNPDIGAVEIK